MTRTWDMHRLLDKAKIATASEGVTAEEKWAANSEVLGYVRGNLVAVVEVLIAAARWDTRSGGLANQELKAAVRALPEFGRKEDAA